ncbi:MAG: hypothetical protein KME28_26795 [Pelatocladus maniniholoensis HA4357-MV3]|jgi:hypothetical protein|uniref:Uncharacterized protein n=1 Tax=Pelatocladus maniniholoensis HA4357-MV3 TaxID=1117104 RepID=A0A9E3LVI9_9NOST|nr:hypothetical protein [Pelatocladus maniniholoensis HA4357-MV3]
MKIIPIPNNKIVRLVRYFHFSLGIVLMISALLLNGCSNTNTTEVGLNWHNARKIPKSLVNLAVSENTSLLPVKVSSIKVATIPTHDKDKHLYILNFNSPDLCGRLGCLYAGYLSQDQGQYSSVMNLYLQPDLPPGKHLISISSDNFTNTSNLPCLDIQQINFNPILQEITYCFDGRYYQPVKNTLLKLPVK